MSWFSSVADRVTSALPTQAQTSEFLTALTLSTDEMKLERGRMEKEERLRNELKDALTSLLPWETNIEERAIFVDECREAILSLSTKESTFHDLPADGDADANTDTDTDTALLRLCRAIQAKQGKVEELGNTSTSLKGILPPLLEQFDLNAHVGLIHRVMKEDPNLVLMHAQLSDSVVEEELFWKNYFYTCALTRLEIGLDINEIWGKDISNLRQEVAAGEASAAARAPAQGGESNKPLIDVSGFRFPGMAATPATATDSEEDEEVISFSEQSRGSEGKSNADEQTAPREVLLPPLLSPNVAAAKSASTAQSKGRDKNSSSPLKDYEMVELQSDDGKSGGGDNDDDDDLDLDELDAEIARELED